MPAVSSIEQIALAIERYPLIRHVFALAAECGAPIYLVGGTVRDLVLDREIHDLDFVTPGDGLALARCIADRTGGAFVPLDRDRKTGRVVLHPVVATGADRTGPAPGKTDANGSYAIYLDVASLRGNSLQADLRGRDLSINAMAIELSADGQWRLHDIVGGLDDLAAGVLRIASPSSLIQDPVRMLRAVRLQSQFGYTIEKATQKCICETAHLLSQVSPERLRDEWFKILQPQGAPDAVLKLNQLGLLQTVAPLIAYSECCPQDPLAARQKGCLHEALACLQAIERLWMAFTSSSPDPQPFIPQALVALAPQIRSRYESTICDERTWLALLKCAALLHNARPAPGGQSDGSPTDRAASAAAEAVAALGRRWHCSNREVNLLYTVALHHRSARQLLTHPGDPPLSRRAIYGYYKKTARYGVDTALVALAHAWAQEPDPPGPGWTRQAENAAQLLAPELMGHTEQIAPSPLLSGHDLIHMLQLAPGPQIGDLLERLREEQAAGEICTREEAIAWLRGLLGQARCLDQKRPGCGVEG